MEREMTSKQRVYAAIHHQQPDRVPQGELGIEGGFLQALLGDDNLPPIARELKARRELKMDLINLHEFPKQLIGYDSDGFPIYKSGFGDVFKQTKHSFQLMKPSIGDISEVASYKVPDVSLCTTHQVEYFTKNCDLFVFALINGPISALDWTLGMEDYLCYAITDTDLIEEFAKKIMEFEVARAKKFIEKGADAIMIADDIAFNTGLFLPPAIMERVGYRIYQSCIAEIKAYKDVPVFLHTDGQMYKAIPEIIDCGFDGLQSLQPSAGMDIYKIKEEYGDRLCLMGNLDLNYLLSFGSPEEVLEETKRLKNTIGTGGGFILSTCNILTDAVPVKNAKAMYLEEIS